MKTLVYVVGIAGCALAFATAVVPHYGHHALAFSVLIVGILPYVTFLVLGEIGMHRSAMLTSFAVLYVDAMVKFILRFIAGGSYDDLTVYVVPVMATLAIAALAYYFSQRTPSANEPADDY